MIRKLNVRLGTIALAVLAASWAVAGPAAAIEKMPPAIVAVVDFQNVMRQSVAFKKATDQLEKHRATFAEEIQKLESQLRAQEEDLKQQRAVLTPEAFNQRVREWQERAAGVQQQVQTRKR